MRFLPFIFLIVSNSCYSQLSSKLDDDFKNQIEIGITAGIINGQTFVDRFYTSGTNPIQNFIQTPIDFLGHLNVSYKRLFSQRSYLVTEILSYSALVNPPEDLFIGLVGLSYRSASIGCGYYIHKKKYQTSVFANIPYRYWGGETLIVGYYNQGSTGLREPAICWTPYNSIGIGVGTDLNYSLTKRLGIVMKAQFNYFPYDNKKIIDPPVLTNQQYISAYKQVNNLFLLGCKISYKFGIH